MNRSCYTHGISYEADSVPLRTIITMAFYQGITSRCYVKALWQRGTVQEHVMLPRLQTCQSSYVPHSREIVLIDSDQWRNPYLGGLLLAT